MSREDACEGELFESIRENLGIRIPDSASDSLEAMTSFIHGLHDEDDPLLSEEHEELLCFWACALRTFGHT